MDKTHSSQIENDKERIKKDISWLEEREKSCAESLKEIYKSLTQSSVKNQQEAVYLEELGDIYLEKSKITNSGRDYIKSAGLFNAAIVRHSDESERETVKRKLVNLVQIFIEAELGYGHGCNKECRAKYTEDITRNKQILQKLRDYCKQELNRIANKYPAYEKDGFIEGLLKEKTDERRKLEGDRQQAIEQLYLQISNGIKSFVGQLTEQCIEVMGQPPCRYAWIGLSSLSRDLATPYSDMESAILVEDDREECKRYFRLLSYFLHIKVIDLGQTIVPILAIKSLYDNNYSWFQDFVTPRGFSFDGNVSWASKNPYGREATRLKPEPMELIKTPFQMANLQTEENAEKEGYHLADILVDVVLIKGDPELIDKYKHYCHQILSISPDKVEENTNDQIKSVKQARGYANLQAEIKEFNITTTLSDKGRSYNVKKEIYRFPTIVINGLSWIFNIKSSNLWNAIRELYKRGVINKDAKHNLLVAISLAAELRLASYTKHGKQSEELVVRESGGFDNERILLPSNQQKIIRYYLTALPFKDIIESTFLNNSVISSSSLAIYLQNDHFYQCTHYYQGKIYERLTMYSEAEISYKRALEEREEEMPEITLDLAGLQIQQGKLEEGKITVHKYCEQYPGKQALRVSNYLGHIHQLLGDYDKAVEYYQESLAMDKQIHGQDAAHPRIAGSLGNLGLAWGNKGDYDKAVEYHQESLAMKKQIHGQDAVHPDIASTLNNLGEAWCNKGDYDKAFKSYNKALHIYQTVFGLTSTHPDKRELENNLKELRKYHFC